MLSAADLAGMRTTLEASLPDTCIVLRRMDASDGAGGTTDTWNAIASDVACRLAPVSRTDRLAEREVAGELSSVAYWVLTLPQGQDVTARDRITVGSRTFEVTIVLAERSWELGRRLLCAEIL